MTADLTPTTDAIRATILRGFEGHDHNLSDEEIRHYAWNTARNLPSVAAETMTWLLDQLAEAREQVAQLTVERDAMRQALEALATHAYSHRDELTDLLDNHAVRLATGETCVLGMPMTCSDAHSAGHCAKPRGAVTNTTAVGIPVIGEVDARSCPAHGCPRVLCECPPARDEASGTTAGGDDR